MEIGHFDISEAHQVTLHLQHMPQGATPQNTIVEINAVAQNMPMIVSFESQKIVFNAGPADQEGFITVRIDINGTEHAAVSTEPYHILTPHPDDHDRASLNSVNPPRAKQGDLITIRGLHLDRVKTLSVGLTAVNRFAANPTSITFRLPRLTATGSQAIRYKDSFMGSTESSSLRLIFEV